MANKYYIRGMEQLGIGVTDVHAAWKWYRENFGADIKILDDDSEAKYMLKYTGGVPHRRHAILAVSLQGGGGFEIWQYKSHESTKPLFDIQLGDCGIYAGKIKACNVEKAHEFFKAKTDGTKTSDLCKDPKGDVYFWLQDPFGNYFQVIHDTYQFKNEGKITGLSAGAVIGVPNIDAAMTLYKDILGYDIEVYKTEAAVCPDFAFVPGGNSTFKRILLRHSEKREGGFGKVFGPSEIELVEVTDRTPRNMFEGRFWGDRGFIHLCFDVQGVDVLREYCKEKGHPFTVDTLELLNGGDFDMGDTSGMFAYIEDQGGTLIEFTEAYKIPITKWFALKLKGRDPQKPLPNLLLKALKLKKYKE
ncbi:MAG: VOC family protein [Bacteroidales bacterium]|nr:VOC family protein [Bacteroidales bacterium]